MKNLLAILTLVAFVWTASGRAQDGHSPPEALTLEVTAQQRENGQLNPALHIFTLDCRKSACELLIQTLNQCKPFSEGTAFYPRIERYSTDSGDLQVRFERKAALATIRSYHNGEFTMNLRFEYRDRSPKQRAFGRSDLVGFSGGYTKQSSVLGQVITVEYVPLRGMFVNRAMDCPANLSGVP